MANVCPVPAPTDPLFQGLLGSADCQVQALVQAGYGALTNGGAFTSILTVLLTLYVAFVGYQLMLGRAQLTLSDFALSAVKIGAILALTTQWPLYERLVFDVLFKGPEQLAELIEKGVGRPLGQGGLIEAFQHAFDDLTLFSPANPPGPNHHDHNAAASLPTWQLQYMSPASHDAFLLMASAFILLISTVGVLLASKIILGLLLAVGPLFITLFLFESTRGVFAGWLRASLAAAFMPLFATVVLGFTLALLAPSLAQIELMNTTNTYIPGVGMQVFILVLVMTGATVGMIIAAGVAAASFKLPTTSRALRRNRPAPPILAASSVQIASRAGRIAAAVEARDRPRIPTSSLAPVSGRNTTTATSNSEERSTNSRFGSEGSRRVRSPPPSRRPN